MNEVLELAQKIYDLIGDQPYQIRYAALNIFNALVDAEEYKTGSRANQDLNAAATPSGTAEAPTGN